MDISLAWLITGFVLIIAELVTGTFYLLVLGIAAFVAAAFAWAGIPFWQQAVVCAAVAVSASIGVHRYRQTISPKRMQALDFGQPASFESWINKSAGHARVKYRDALWDAQISGEASGEPGEILYVTAVDGSTLKVSKIRPA